MVTNPSPALPTGTVIGRILFIDQDQSDANTEPDYSIINGTVKFICSVRGPIQVASQSTTLIPLSFDATFDSEGYLVSQGDTALVRGIRLPATDSSVYNPSNFTWKVVFDIFDSTTGNQIRVDPFSIAVPTDGTVDLSTAMPVSEARGDVIIRGETGATGATPNLYIGTTTTGAPGSAASVSISGATPEAKTISFTIPRGDVGAPANITILGTSTGPAVAPLIGPPGVKGDPGGIVIGTDLGTTDLNTVVTSGSYRQSNSANAAVSRNYPKDTISGVMIVLERVSPGASASVIQQYTPTVSAAAGTPTTYYRYSSTNNTIWSPWRAYNSTRVDQTAGRAIYQWDDLNGRDQLLWGDTGERDIITALGNGATWGALKLRRVGSMVELTGVGWICPANGTVNALTANVPSGFRNNNSKAIFGVQNASTLLAGTVAGNTGVPTLYSCVSGASINFAISWQTLDAWPTSLPGTASGAVPAS